MENTFTRTIWLIGEEKYEILKNANILIFGLGGVGGYALEALARSGVENFTIVDADIVNPSNINRQIIANNNSIGKNKTEAFKERLLSINNNINIDIRTMFVSEENIDTFDFNKYDYIIDAIDSVKSKIAIIKKATDLNIKIISAMGAGNKINPTFLEVSDIYKTTVDPLAKAVRLQLKKLKIKKLKVVYSKERPIKASDVVAPSSMIFVPATMGLIIASEVTKDLIDLKNETKGA